MRPRDLPQLLKEAASEWIEDGAMRLSSSLAYYAIFSLAPLLVIVISIAGLVFGEEAARGQIAQQISALAGARAGEAIQATVQASASEKTTGVLATIIGLVVLLFGASTVFAELKDALNTIWGVTVKPGRAFFTLVRDRFLSFSIVLAIGFLLLVSLVLSAVLAALGKYMSARLPLPAAVWQACDFLVSFAVISALFAMIFKMLPNVRIGWHDVRIGAVGTALLFTIGKFLIGLYLGTKQHRFELRRGRLGGDRARMDLLLVVHPVFRRGVHESLRSQIRLRHRAEQSCGARERFAASKTLFGANAAITKATR